MGTSHREDYLQSIVDATDIKRLRKEHEKAGVAGGADFTEYHKGGPLPIYRKGTILISLIPLRTIKKVSCFCLGKIFATYWNYPII